jgi:hypothetical protein
MYSNIQHFIEGFNIADLGWGTSDAKAVTLSFWVKLSITGTFGFNLRSTNAGWSYASTFTYSSANTWQFVSTTIPGPTIGGTDVFTNDNGLGVGIFWDLGVGPNLTTSTLNSWQAVNILGVTGTTKLNATTGATYQLTGVQLEVGSSATSFEYRSYGQELVLCQRYYYQHCKGASQNVALGTLYNASTMISCLQFPTSMRTSPSLVSSSGTDHFTFFRNDGGDTFTSFNAIGEVTTASANIRNTSEIAGASQGVSGLVVSSNASALLAFNAEL